MTRRPNRLKQALLDRRPVYGLFCSTPSPIVVELIGYAGFDFVIIDTEHTLVNPETLEHMIRAAEVVGLTSLVRVGEPAAGSILRALDAGAQGIIVPRVRSAEAALQAVQASRYYPQGERGLGAGRPARFGAIDLATYVQHENEQILVGVMVADRQGVEHADETLAIEGIDLVLEGAADLSQSLGRPWETRHPEVRDALCRLQTACRSRGVPFFAIPRVPEDSEFWWQRGVRAFVLDDERGIALRALQSQRQIFQRALLEAGSEDH